MKFMSELFHGAAIAMLLAVTLLTASLVKAETQTIYVAAFCHQRQDGQGACFPSLSSIRFNDVEKCEQYTKWRNEVEATERAKSIVKFADGTVPKGPWVECFKKDVQVSVWTTAR